MGRCAACGTAWSRPCSGDRDEQRLAEEIDLHLALETDALVRQGLAPDAARREAHRRLGGAAWPSRKAGATRAGCPGSTPCCRTCATACAGCAGTPRFTALALLTLALRHRRDDRDLQPAPRRRARPAAVPRIPSGWFACTSRARASRRSRSPRGAISRTGARARGIEDIAGVHARGPAARDRRPARTAARRCWCRRATSTCSACSRRSDARSPRPTSARRRRRGRS